MKRKILFSACSDTGRVREINEDNWLADAQRGLFAVSDGLGGHRAGEIASRMVVDTLPHVIDKHVGDTSELSPEYICQQLEKALRDLSNIVHDTGKDEPEQYGMGATVVMLLIRGNAAYAAHMGDSRLYLYRRQRLQQITHDHSLVQYLLDTEAITPDQARTHGARGQISQFAGMEDDPLPDAQLLQLQSGDRLLLCTDGLTGMLDDDQIINIFERQTDVEACCGALIDAANEADGRDNITAIVIDLIDTPDA